MRLILVRHGDAHAGFTGPISGPSGCRGLTDLGRKQATKLRVAICDDPARRADVLVTSMLPRAIETAGIIAPALGFDDVPLDCDWCEVHTGAADGVLWADYPATFGAFDMTAEPDRPFAPDGDSWNSFHERVDRTLDRYAIGHAGQTVVAVTSAGVIAASLRIRFAGPYTSEPRMVPSNTGLTEWEFDDSRHDWTLRSYDEVGHLTG